MTAHRPRAPDIDPQCPFLLQRIDELQVYLSSERDATRAQPSRQQLRALLERARCLRCFDTVPADRAVDSVRR